MTTSTDFRSNAVDRDATNDSETWERGRSMHRKQRTNVEKQTRRNKEWNGFSGSSQMPEWGIAESEKQLIHGMESALS
eukprot:2559069-Rhodomonas_salina.1